jgi:hypothetical protein
VRPVLRDIGGIRIVVDCPHCGTPLALSPPFNVRLAGEGPTVEPDFLCHQCGFYGHLKRGKVIERRGGLSIPPDRPVAVAPAPSRRRAMQFRHGTRGRL